MQALASKGEISKTVQNKMEQAAYKPFVRWLALESSRM
jgi:hypothetical protein